MTDTQPTDGSTTRLLRVMREFVAAVLWAYIVVKLAVFDIDLYIVQRFSPRFVWLLNLKVFVLIGLSAIAWVVLGRRQFPLTILYILAYPLVVIFWRVPQVAFRRWPLFIAFAPGVYRAVRTFRTTYELYAAAAVAALAVELGSSKVVLLAGMLVLAGFLVTHLYRSFRKAYSSSVFKALSSIMIRIRNSVEKGSLDTPAHLAAQLNTQSAAAQNATSSDPSGLYLLRCFTDIVHSKIQSVARGRSYDLYLITSWLYTVVLTAVVFAFEYLGLHKVDVRQFFSADNAGFWAFLGFSLGALTPARVLTIAPGKTASALMCYCEAGCSILILVILFFTVLTAAREAFKDDLLQFATELDLIATAVDERVTAVYRMTLAEAENFLLQNQGGMVNLLRKARGLPELPIPAKSSGPQVAAIETVNPADPEKGPKLLAEKSGER